MSSPVVQVTLSEDVTVELGRALAEIRAGRRFMIDRDMGEIMALGGREMRRTLPAEALRRIGYFGGGQGRRPILWVRSLPEPAEMPPTPCSGFGDDTLAVVADLCLAGVYSLAGIAPVAYATENHGRLVRNVVPNPAEAGVKSSHGFDAELDWHTDGAFGEFEELALGRGPGGWRRGRRFPGFSGSRACETLMAAGVRFRRRSCRCGR